MKKMLLALAAIFAVAGVSSVQADCGCKREPKPCPTKQCEEKVRPCRKKCERVSRCQKCAKSKCGCMARNASSEAPAVVSDEAVNSDDMIDSEDDMLVDSESDEVMNEDVDATAAKAKKAKAKKAKAKTAKAKTKVAKAKASKAKAVRRGSMAHPAVSNKPVYQQPVQRGYGHGVAGYHRNVAGEQARRGM